MLVALAFLPIVLFIAFALWAATVGAPVVRGWLESAKYPVRVPGWRTRLSEHPPFGATVEDVARANEIVLRQAVAKGYASADVRRRLDRGLVRWVSADPNVEGRGVRDPFNRKKQDGTPLRLAGWHEGDSIYVVYLPTDTLADTAYCHEQGHSIHVLKNLSDYAHADLDMWGPDGIVSLSKKELKGDS